MYTMRSSDANRISAPTGADSAAVFRATAEALASAIAAKDSYYQPEHVGRVRRACELMGAQLGLDAHTIEGITVAALVRDVGKLGVPEHIVLKPGPLDPEEFALMAEHASIGAKLLENVDYPWNVAEMVLYHHEHFDGTGYPHRLAGEDIPLGSRIISVAEVYDALISDRCYRKGWTHQEAVAYIEKLAGSHFDPGVVEAFLRIEPALSAETQSKDEGESGHGRSARCADECSAGEAIAQANRELMSLFDLAQTLSSTLELEHVLSLLSHRTRRLLQASSCAVFLFDESEPRSLTAHCASGRYCEALRGSSAKLGEGVTGATALSANPYIGKYDQNDLLLGMTGQALPELRSCICAPIVSGGRVIGTINAYDVAAQAFTDDDLRTLSMIAGRASMAIQNACTFERVRDSAMRDSLTCLHNGRYLSSFLDHEMSRATRLGEALSILQIDLDHFKEINDLFGHPAGDTVLRDVARIFENSVRDYDVVARTGGDEFVVVLPSTPASEAQVTAERIKESVNEYAGSCANCAAVGLSASVGLATYPDDATDLETLLKRGDAAMYRDKRAKKQGNLAA